MKKQTVYLILILVVITGIILYTQSLFVKKQDIRQNGTSQERQYSVEEGALGGESSERTVKVTVDFGDKEPFVSNVEAKNAYEAIAKVAQGKKWKLSTREYTYGLMAVEVGEKKNGDSGYWAYYVNGKPGPIAADRYIIHPGDNVEWKFGKITP